MTIVIREAGLRDVPAIAQVHVTAWQETYRGILPDAVIAASDVSVREHMWHAIVADQASETDVFVVDIGGAIVGFGACGPARDALVGGDGEIYAVYLLKRWQCRGIGSRLMGVLASALARRGCRSAGLWVARDNLAAIAFYRALGGTIGTARERAFAETHLVEIAVGWDDVIELALWDGAEVKAPRPSRKPASGGARSPSSADRTAHRDAALPA